VSDEEVRRTAEPYVELFDASPHGAAIARSDAPRGEGCRDRCDEKRARKREAMRTGGLRRVRRDRGLVLDEVRRVGPTLVLRDGGSGGGRRVERPEEQHGADRTRDEEARGRAECHRASSEMRAPHAYGNPTDPRRSANLFGMAIA
jgi:hypothetical protein